MMEGYRALLSQINEKYMEFEDDYTAPVRTAYKVSVFGGGPETGNQTEGAAPEDTAQVQGTEEFGLEDEQFQSARFLRALPLELQAAFMDLIKKNTQRLRDSGEVLFFLQQQHDSEFSYLPDMKKGQRIRPMRYVFGWQNGEAVAMVPGKTYEFEKLIPFPNPISYPPYDFKRRLLMSTPSSAWTCWARDVRKVAKRRQLVTRSDVTLDQAYGVELLLLTPEADRVFRSRSDYALVREPRLGAIANLYSPKLPAERREFIENFWIKDTPYFLFDIKNRELLEVYYRWKQTGVMPQFTYVFRFANTMEDVQSDFELAVVRYVLSTRYPPGSDARNQLLLDRLNLGVKNKRRPTDCIPPDVLDDFRLFKKMLEARGHRQPASGCQHVAAVQTVNAARSSARQYKAFQELKLMLSADIQQLDTGSREAVLDAIANEVEPKCAACGERVLCLHRYCLLNNQLRFKADDLESEDTTWETLKVFVESFFSNSKQQVFVCQLCGSSLTDDVKPDAKQDVLQMNIYDERERGIIYNRVQHVFSLIGFPDNVNVKRSTKNLDKILYNVVYNDAQRYARRTPEEYLKRFQGFLNAAISAYVALLGKMVKLNLGQFSLATGFEAIDAVLVERYKQLLRNSVVLAYTVGLKYQNPVRDPVDLYLQDVGELAPTPEEENADEESWRAARSEIVRGIQRSLESARWIELDLKQKARVTEATRLYFARRVSFPISLTLSTKDRRYQLQRVPITVVYGENGARHDWTLFKVAGKDKLLDKRELAESGAEVVDRFSPKTKAFASQTTALDEGVVLRALADDRDRENIVTYYATDCPADNMVHEMEAGRCRKCGFSLKDPTEFIDKYKAKYIESIQAEKATETRDMFDKLLLPPPEYAPLPAEQDAPKSIPAVHKDNFDAFALSQAFGPTENRLKVQGLLLDLVRKFKQFVESEMLTEKEDLVTRADVGRLKRAVLRLAAGLIEKHGALALQIADTINAETANYLKIATQVSAGFSLYFNDFTDQMEVPEKSTYEKETMDVHGDKVFEDEEVNEDDTSAPQD